MPFRPILIRLFSTCPCESSLGGMLRLACRVDGIKGTNPFMRYLLSREPNEVPTLKSHNARGSSRCWDAGC